MHVVATAGHVDHGKSTLVRALTGMEPDRLAEEQRRGMTIDLGFAWTGLPTGEQVAFVDVPGHERFLTTTVAGLGPVPAVLVVVAADEGWMPQTEEHVAALTALGATHLLLVVTKTDLAAPEPVVTQARDRLARHGHRDIAAVAVSAATGEGVDDVRRALSELVSALPRAVPDAPVRLWVDRVFTIRGAGTVVTGTLGAGTIRAGDDLELQPAGRPVTVRGLQSMGEQHREVGAVARVAVNLRGVDRDDVRRGMALLSPQAWTPAIDLDVLVNGDELPSNVVVHLGSAAVPARHRRLSDRAARLRLSAPLPLHVGDRILLRDPASRRIAGAVAADLSPDPIRRRGDARRIGESLQVPASADDEVARRGICSVEHVARLGLDSHAGAARRIGSWLVAPATWTTKREQLQALVAADADAADGVPMSVLRRRLELPDDAVVAALVDEVPGLVHGDGRVRPRHTQPETPRLEPLIQRLTADPFAAPDATELAETGATRAELARAVAAGLLVRVADSVYVGPAAADRALASLGALPQPFTVSDARQALGSTRRVVVPLLEHLDAARRTRRLPDGSRVVVTRAT